MEYQQAGIQAYWSISALIGHNIQGGHGYLGGQSYLMTGTRHRSRGHL